MNHRLCILLTCIATWYLPSAWAQSYPSKPIKAIVPFAAGSATDLIGRGFAARMSELLGQPIIIENKPGVNGMLGADTVAKSPADGYTLLFGTNSTNAALKSLMKKLPYDQDTAFLPVGYFGSVPLIVAVNNRWNWDTSPDALRRFIIPQWRPRSKVAFHLVEEFDADEHVEIKEK